MTRRLPADVLAVLRRGAFCHLAVPTEHGPHVTPLVFVARGGSLWVTTSRRSVKARAWRRERRVGGMVRAGTRAVSFQGRVTAYDILDPSTWGASVLAGPRITAAAVAFTRRNARFFAGYAVDAARIPLAWTPPGRVFAEVALESVALVDGGAVRKWGPFRGGGVPSRGSFRARSGPDALDGVPSEVRDRLAEGGPATLAVGTGAQAVLPAAWVRDRGSLYAVLPIEVLRLAAGDAEFPAALTVDHASRWRATAMAGVLVQGTGTAFALDGLGSGARSAAAIVERAGVQVEGAALVRVRPARVVWWRGWASGTVTA